MRIIGPHRIMGRGVNIYYVDHPMVEGGVGMEDTIVTQVVVGMN